MSPQPPDPDIPPPADELDVWLTQARRQIDRDVIRRHFEAGEPPCVCADGSCLACQADAAADRLALDRGPLRPAPWQYPHDDRDFLPET